jgi:hypothetical protein
MTSTAGSSLSPDAWRDGHPARRGHALHQRRGAPELVTDRIVRFAEAVSRENVVASTDCGPGGRVHPQIAWAKLDTLVKGAKLAASQLRG